MFTKHRERFGSKRNIELDIYVDNNGGCWVSLCDLATSVGASYRKIYNWYKRICTTHYESVKARTGMSNNVITSLYPIELATEYFTYWVNHGGLVKEPIIPKEVAEQYVYLIKAEGLERYKIGITTTSIGQRLKELQTSSPVQLSCIHSSCVYDAFKVERDLHHHFKAKRMVGEWFTLTPADVQDCISMMNTRAIGSS